MVLDADRLTDAGVSYNVFGDITAVPATDAGGEALTSEYYIDNQVASQKQGEQTIGYSLDPDGRTLETLATGNRTEAITNHYAGPGDTPMWTSNAAGETTREISDITGTLVATQSNLETPVLQLANLHGDIIATAYLSETASGLASKADTSEYGVPTTSLPPKYAWLGTLEIPTELPSGTLNLGARSYVPQLGRFLQPDPIPGGSANAYSYTSGDPVNTSDPSGEYTASIEGWAREESTQIAGSAANIRQTEIAAELAAQRAAEEAIAREEAETAAQEASWAAWWAGYDEAEWGEEEWYEEEGGEEYAAYHQGTGSGHEQAHVESGVLEEKGASFGPGIEAGEGQTHRQADGAVPLCNPDSQTAGAPCARYALSLGGALGWIKKRAGKLLRSGLKVVIGAGLYAGGVAAGALAVLGTAACFDATDGLDAYHCLGIGLGAGSASEAAFVAGTLAFKSALHEWF